MSALTWRSISHHLVKENLGGNRYNKGFIYVIRANSMSFWGRGFESQLEFSSTEYAITCMYLRAALKKIKLSKKKSSLSCASADNANLNSLSVFSPSPKWSS